MRFASVAASRLAHPAGSLWLAVSAPTGGSGCPTAIGKKNWLFIGHPKAGQRSAILYTIIEPERSGDRLPKAARRASVASQNCRLCGINPLEYLCDVMPRIMDHPASRVSELLPRQWQAARDADAQGTKAEAD